ncbi:hypothetical protein K1T71_012239 [Dendrolimus kikuchii]|uniref:Uncharacterized protein n=1 Tax=Dendrolimus kikuchii TaxID=765133 RepID=A0ACC1CLE0_9NEOP|nr:hypothetical protein K1T71_012239 [Dendrolimus kikuchii]
MGRSRFPGKPLKFHNRKRISLLSGTVYHETAPENNPPARGPAANDFTGEQEEEEKKENNNETNETTGNKHVDCTVNSLQDNLDKSNSDPSKSPVRTRSQNKMESPKDEKPKPIKKTVTFGTVESCEDIFFPLKKIPLKHHAPLVPIIKKKSALKPTEHSMFNSILKPAKLTDLSSKSTSEHQEGYLRKNLNPLSTPINKFSQVTESRCISPPPPPRNTSPIDKESGGPKFILPMRSAHSSRVIKPNKRFIDGEEHSTTISSITSSKVLKKPKLKTIVFNNLHDDDTPEEEIEKSHDTEKVREKLIKSSNLFKDKTTNSFPSITGSKKSLHDIFSYEKEFECLQDESSNLEGLEKLKTAEGAKDNKTGHAMRKLMDISDASSSSSTSSGSESEESWDSDSPGPSGDEEERQPQSSPEKDKTSASQLLRGKVIIREARLQLNPPAQSTSGLDGPFSTSTQAPSPNPPTTVTCGVCGAVRFYRFVKQARKFGIYSCESCRKFISKMLKKEKLSQRTVPVVMQCLKGEGNCHVPPIVRSQQWKLLRCTNKARCPACWLKMCLKAFQVPPSIRAGLTAMLPPYMRSGIKSPSPLIQTSPLRTPSSNTTPVPPVFALSNNDNDNKIFGNLKAIKKSPEDIEKIEDKTSKEPPTPDENNEDFSLSNKKRQLTKIKVRKKEKSESKQTEDPKRQKVELKGPRVKHVCRSASIVLGQPIATFPTQEEKEKQEKTSENENPIPVLDKDTETPELSSCESEIDLENKAPMNPDDLGTKDTDSEGPIEIKKRKIEAPVPIKQTKADSSEDETIMDLVPKKSIMKPLSNITNVRGRSQKCGQNRPELICVDFWESYDPDEVCNSGFGLIGTGPFTIAKLCFLCGSAGKEKMVACGSCCEWYHPWCVEEAGAGAGGGGRGWACARCVSCAACKRGAARVRCRGCAAHHHAACLPRPPPEHRGDWPQICSSCLKCKSCDSNRVSKFVGSLPFCGPCFKLRQKGNYCPLCQACYRDNDFDSKMMECGWCARWVHASCEGLSGEGYQLLSALPPSIEYICCKCMPNDPPWRKMVTEHLKGRLLHLLKLLAKNKKACALLKLTPHKNTPVPSKPYRLMSPQAIRKLHFGVTDDSMKNTTETKVYRNTARGRKNNSTPSKFEDTNPSQAWNCSSLITDVDMEKKDIPHTHKVVNLQEPLMQNKEVCFSTGLFGAKTEFDTPCVEVHENYSPQNKTEKATTMLPTTIHDDKYEVISDDDEPLKSFPQARSEQDLSPAIVRDITMDCLDDSSNDLSRILSPSLLDIKKRVNSDEYVSLKDFNHDMKEVIDRTTNDDLSTIYKDLFMETFPWFDCENNCLQPNLEVEGEHEDTESLKDIEISENKGARATTESVERPIDQIVPKLEDEGPKDEEDLMEFYSVTDTRICVLCKAVGDGGPSMEGRLLYCGQNDWIHANCALWSAEVFEEIDGSLQNVHSAISRGKMIKCAACEVKGASVGCCAKNCSETYHYACARKENCAFMDDKRVFCPTHGKDVPKRSLQKDADFELTRPVYVELDKKKKRYSEISKVQFILGSLTVHSLGKIVPSVSDYEDFLMPVDFSCTRLFWSCKKPSKIVRYTIKTKLLLAEPLPGFDFGVNITVDHTLDIQIVDRVMAEIGAWHQSLETGTSKAVFMRKNDKSPIKLGSTVTLEDLAVKQVVEYLLDNVCKQEQQDEEEPQNTADLLPPEVKDAIFEDLNHDLLDGISMQDIFQDLKNEFYCAMSQSDDKSNDKSDFRSTDFIDELLNARLESGSKELKRSKSEMLLQSHGLKTLTTGRGQQRSSSWNNKFDPSLLSSTIKRCKIGKSSTVTGKLSPVQRLPLIENTLDTIKDSDTNVLKKVKLESCTGGGMSEESPHTSGINFRIVSPKKEEVNSEKTEKTEGYYTEVIDFYTKIQCSPISQLDGAADWSGSESTCSSRPSSPRDNDFTPIQQLDGAEEHHPSDNGSRGPTNQFMYRASGTESYTVTFAGNSMSGQPELVMRPLDDTSGNNPMEQPVRCDRCQCTYRNKESYDRHVPSCDMVSTSESESENPKSPENRTLTTLQNAFQGAFAQPMIIHAGVVSGTENTVKAEGISARRTSINTRQITINGTIVETPSPGPSNEMTMTITEQMKSGTVIFDQSKTTNVQVSTNQQMLSSPQIVVTPQMLLPKTSSASGQKIMAPQIIAQPGLLPYNICVKPGNNGNLQPIQGSADMTQLLSGSGGIQVISSNSNQVLTIPSNQQPIIQGKNQITNFPNMASASSIALPVNSIQGMPNTSIIQNIQPMIRPQMQGNPTIVVPAMTTQRLTSPNSQNKQQIILPGTPQKSPKKQPAPVHPKPIFQSTNRGRGRTMSKPTTIKTRQTKLEKTFTTINQTPIGPGNTVIQLQTNNQTGQPSIIVQPVTNQNIMSAYVEALSQQQNQNMQYIATIAPQGDFKTGPTQFISQSGLVPQTFQIQQTESGGLVAVPSGGIPVILPQGNVGILPQAIQQGATILPQGAIQTQGIISQGPNGPTILPQAIHTQNGTTIIPQGTIQGLTSGNITSQATLLPNNTLQTAGAAVVPQSGIGNGQTTIIPNAALQTQGNTLISSAPGATIIPQGTLLPQFCNDSVLLGSAPTLEMVTDPSGCMYLTTTQPVYYGLETIVQNTVMSSQQFVSTAMQGVLAQNSSFSATTTQVFQASKIEPIVEVPTGYVVVNNVGDGVSTTSTPNVVTAQSVQSSPPSIKTVKTTVPNLTLQPLPDKSLSNNNRQTPKVIHMGPQQVAIGSQSGSGTIITGRANLNPITSQIHSMTLSNATQNLQRGNMMKPSNVSMAPSVTLVSSTGQPIMAISQSIPNSSTSYSMQPIPLSQPIVSSSVAPSNKNMKIENSHVIEISGNLQDNSSSNLPTISVPTSIKSPTPWKQINPPNSSGISENKLDLQNITMKPINMNSAMNLHNNITTARTYSQNDSEKLNQNCLMPHSHNSNAMSGMNIHSHQFESNINVSHQASSHSTPNNVIQITAGNIYPPSSIMNTNFDTDTTLKLSKINALSKAEGGHLNFSQEIMASHSHSQQHANNDKSFQNMGPNESKHISDNSVNQMNIHKLNSCQMAGNISNTPAISIIPHNMMRSQMQNNQNSISVPNNSNQLCSITSSSSHGQIQILNPGNNSMQTPNLSCQEASNNRMSMNVANENSIQSSQQLELSSSSMNSSCMPHGNMQIISHENNQLSTPNQIHIMNGQIQHSRQMENTQMPPPNQGTPNRSFHDSIGVQQSLNQTSILPNRSTPDNNNIMNQTMSMHMSNNNHGINRSELNDIGHMHMQQSMSNMNMQNNRMMMDNIQSHSVSNMNHTMHSNRAMENMHNSQMHSMQQMNHHMTNNSRAQMENNIHVNQQMSLQQNRQMDSVGLHHQHQLPNVMQIQNNRQHVDNTMMGMHQHMPNQMLSRQQLENNMHMHHMPSNTPNLNLNSQMDNSGSMPNIHSNRYDNNSMTMQNINAMNQIQSNRNSMEHTSLMQHQMSSMSSINNMNLHNNMNSGMQLSNSGHQSMNNSLMHVPNIPDIKNDIQSSCGVSCSNTGSQFPNSQTSMEICNNINSNNMTIGPGSMMHGMNVNSSNMSNNIMMNTVSNSSMYGPNSQNNLSSHDMLMSCNNAQDHTVSNLITGSSNHMLMTQSHTTNTPNQTITSSVPNNSQININSCSMNTNNQSQNMTNIENQINRNAISVNDSSKFVQEPLRGKNMMGSPSNPNMNISNIPSNDCAKVNMVGDKQNHTISVSNQIGYMQMNSQNNRVINLPERNRINNLENNINQNVPQQHNIRVVTNNSNTNVGGITAETLAFQQKNENTNSTSTMINVPFQAIPNSAPMNINVNSSNNTVNITVQNNLVDPKIASKAAADINFPLQANTTTILPNQNSSNNMICIPVPNNTINLPTQNSSSITLPKAPPTQQSGIPTNVVNPMSMRPMNRVLPLHRDGQSKSSKTSTSKIASVPKQRPVSHDMPDLNIKDETIDSDLEKAIEESKRMMELERARREKEDLEAVQAMQLSADLHQPNTSSASNEAEIIAREPIETPKPSLPNLVADMIDITPPKILVEKDTNRNPVSMKSSNSSPKVMKRPLTDRKYENDGVTKKHTKIPKGQENRSQPKQTADPPKDDGPKLIYEVTSEDGFNYSSSSLSDLWAKVIEAVQNARKQAGLPLIQYNLPFSLSGAHLLGLNNNALRYLIEQLPGASRCTKYKIRQGRQLSSWDNDLDLSEGFKESAWGSARAGPVLRKQNHDMFSWMASPFREEPPPFGGQEGESSISRRLATLPPAMRFRQLKETSKASVGVYRSHIHGRGLFCKKDIEEGDMVIEYAGEVIRAVLADQREKRYEAMSGRRGVGGCYMFRIDDHLVVDATLKGNAARFINHSCDPNCYSRVVDIHGHKHILIFALRRITVGEELTYDYKFPFEEVKIPCTCGAKKCRKYLN